MAERMSEPPVFLESPLGLTVDERKAIEMVEAEAGERPKLCDSGESHLWLCCFINCFVAMTDFGSVIRFKDSWNDSMGEERWSSSVKHCLTQSVT